MERFKTWLDKAVSLKLYKSVILLIDRLHAESLSLEGITLKDIVGCNLGNSTLQAQMSNRDQKCLELRNLFIAGVNIMLFKLSLRCALP